jgi:hypothetical protein
LHSEHNEEKRVKIRISSGQRTSKAADENIMVELINQSKEKVKGFFKKNKLKKKRVDYLVVYGSIGLYMGFIRQPGIR